jgi:xylose isomerase
VMMVFLEGGGLQGGGINFDAKTRRNSTDLADIFHAHIGGMDVFARALMLADAVLSQSKYPAMKAARYASFDSGDGKAFAEGKLTLQDLAKIAGQKGEPTQRSGQQELFENIINQFL